MLPPLIGATPAIITITLRERAKYSISIWFRDRCPGVAALPRRCPRSGGTVRFSCASVCSDPILDATKARRANAAAAAIDIRQCLNIEKIETTNELGRLISSTATCDCIGRHAIMFR
jgi:hypothetical protein